MNQETATDPVTADELRETMQRLSDNAGSANGMGGGYSASWRGRTEYQWRQRLLDERDRRGLTDFYELLAELVAEEDPDAQFERMMAEEAEQLGKLTDDELHDLITEVAQQRCQSGEFNIALDREITRRGWWREPQVHRLSTVEPTS